MREAPLPSYFKGAKIDLASVMNAYYVPDSRPWGRSGE